MVFLLSFEYPTSLSGKGLTIGEGGYSNTFIHLMVILVGQCYAVFTLLAKCLKHWIH